MKETIYAIMVGNKYLSHLSLRGNVCYTAGLANALTFTFIDTIKTVKDGLGLGDEARIVAIDCYVKEVQ